jgi:hypothetical protein
MLLASVKGRFLLAKNNGKDSPPNNVVKSLIDGLKSLNIFLAIT